MFCPFSAADYNWECVADLLDTCLSALLLLGAWAPRDNRIARTLPYSYCIVERHGGSCSDSGRSFATFRELAYLCAAFMDGFEMGGCRCRSCLVSAHLV